MNDKKHAIKKLQSKKTNTGKKVVISSDNNDSVKVEKMPSVFMKKNTDNIQFNILQPIPNNNKLIVDNNNTILHQEATLDELIQSSQNTPDKISSKTSPKMSPKVLHNVEFKGNPPVNPPSGWGDEEIVETEDFEIEEGEVVEETITDNMDIDTEEDNFPDQTQIEEYNKEDFEQDKNMYINGILYQEFKKLPHNKQVNSVQCSYCQKFYSKTQQPKMFTTEFTEGEPVCFHCIFWTNYDVTTRPHVDGVYGMTIVEYVMECKDLHDKAVCTRNSDAGGCLLCDYLNGVPIDNVLGADVLINELPKQESVEDDKDYLQSVDCSFVITI